VSSEIEKIVIMVSLNNVEKVLTFLIGKKYLKALVNTQIGWPKCKRPTNLGAIVLDSASLTKFDLICVYSGVTLVSIF